QFLSANIPLLLLAVMQFVAAALLVIHTSGLPSLAGWALGLSGLPLSIWLLRNASASGSSGALVSVLRLVNAAQGDLSRSMPEHGDAATREAARLFNEFMEKLRGALEELRMHS